MTKKNLGSITGRIIGIVLPLAIVGVVIFAARNHYEIGFIGRVLLILAIIPIAYNIRSIKRNNLDLEHLK